MSRTGGFWKNRRHLVLIIIVLAIVLGVTEYLFYRHGKNHARRDFTEYLTAIVDSKVDQIELWRAERMHDAFSIFNDMVFSLDVRLWVNPRTEEAVRIDQREETYQRLVGLKRDIYESAVLLGHDGSVQMAIPGVEPDLLPLIREVAGEAARTRTNILTDIHELPGGNGLGMSLAVPIRIEDMGYIEDIGVLVLQIDPNKFLFPLIQQWRNPLPTGEIVMVRKEADKLVCLHELSQGKKTAQIKPIPIDDPGTICAKIAAGERGYVEGLDCSGKPAVAVVRAVVDSPWILVVRVDATEINGEIWTHLQPLSFILFGLFMVILVGVTFAWRNREVDFYRQQLEEEGKRLALAMRYENLTRFANDMIIVMDQDWRIVEANDRALVGYGYERNEFFNLRVWDLYPDGNFPAPRDGFQDSDAEPGLVFEAKHRRKNGSIFPVEVSRSVVIEGNRRWYQSIIRDVSERVQREAALRESEREMRHLSSRLLVVQEEERRRIGRELHDELGQALMVLKFRLDEIEAGIPKENESLKAAFITIFEYMHTIIEKVRALCWNLSPAHLEQLGLSAAIKNLIEEYEERMEVTLSPAEITLDGFFSLRTQVNIYRIFQEILTNIGRYAQASRISVNIEEKNNIIYFVVSDNGLGFDLNQVLERQGKDKGIGLVSIQERVRSVGGTMTIRSQPGAGTEISFSVPIDTES